MMDQLEGEGILLANSKKEKRRERKNEKKRDEKSRKSSDKLPEKKFKSRETIPSSDSDFDMEASNPKISKKVTHSESSDEEEATKTKEVKANASIVGAIFKQKKSRESSNPPAGEKKEEKSKVKQSQKDPKESPLKKKKKVSRERSLSFSSSDSWSSPTSASASARKPSSGS